MAGIERKILKLSEGQALRIEGPAFIRIYKGRVKAFGKELGYKDYLIIPKGEAYIIEVLEESTVEFRSGEGSAIDELKTTFIPPEWVSLSNLVAGLNKPRIVVIGGEKSGRGALVTYLVNTLLEKGLSTAIIDSSLSQPEVGPPAFVTLAEVSEPLPSLREGKVRNAYFVGSLFLEGVGIRVIAGVEKMLQDAKELNTNSLIVLTPTQLFGWTAREVVNAIISVSRPDVVVVIEQAQEAEHLLKPMRRMTRIKIVRIPVGHVKIRTSEEWRVFREIMFKKYMGIPRKRVFHLGEVSLKHVIYGSGVEASDAVYEIIKKKLGSDNVIYAEDTADALLVITKHPVKQDVSELAEQVNKQVIVRQAGVEQGLMVGLFTSSEYFKGVGVIDNINYRKGKITIWTGVEKASIIHVGLVRVSLEKWEEQGAIPYGFPF